MRIRTILTYGVALLITTLLIGCNSNSSNNTQQGITGYLVYPFDSNINYKCGNKNAKLSSDGKFQCPSFPVNFYTNNEPIGHITSLHNDGYVFPQDIIQNRELIGEIVALVTR